MVKLILLLLQVLGFSCGAHGQYVGPPRSNPCPPGFQIHGYSCYRYINMAASWMDAKVVCGTMASSLVSIDNQDENQYLTALVQNETHVDGTKNTDTLAQRIWTSGANFQGQPTWTSSNLLITYSSWHRGEPYVTSLRDVFCVMKMQDDWYSDQCKHERKFVCEKKLDGLVVPYVPTDIKEMGSTTKPSFTKSEGIQTFG